MKSTMAKSKTKSNKNDFGQITKVERHHIETVNIYEVSDGELRELETGNDADTFLNMAVACLSFALACFLSIISSQFKSDMWKLFICCITVIFGLTGLIMSVLWLKKRKSKKSIIAMIRDRRLQRE